MTARMVGGSHTRIRVPDSRVLIVVVIALRFATVS